MRPGQRPFKPKYESAELDLTVQPEYVAIISEKTGVNVEQQTHREIKAAMNFDVDGFKPYELIRRQRVPRQ